MSHCRYTLLVQLQHAGQALSCCMRALLGYFATHMERVPLLAPPCHQPLNQTIPFAQELVCQERPLRGHLRAPRVPEECPEAVRALMEACIEAEAPALRPSAFEVFVRLANRWGTC